MKRDLKAELYDYDMYINHVPDLFIWHFEGDDHAAEFFGVTPRTVRNWHKNRNWPVAVVRLLLVIHRGFLPPSKPWRGFRIQGDKLYTPGGRELSTYDLQELDIKMSLGQNVVHFARKKKNNYYLLHKWRKGRKLRPFYSS